MDPGDFQALPGGLRLELNHHDRSWANKHVLAVTQYPASVKKVGGGEQKGETLILLLLTAGPGSTFLVT